MSSASYHNIEEILENIMKPLYTKGFRFRDFQKETILRIAKTSIEKPETSILIDAPTGTGKSILSIVGSLLLNKINKTGYIMTSDLGLQTQYESDIDNLGLYIPSVRGLDNYTCLVNMLNVSLGECKTKGGNKRDLPCYQSCSYYSRRDAAADSMTSLLNYSYWLLQLNYASKNTEGSLFTKRDFCFFDEAHKIQDIVQTHFSPRLGKTLVDMITEFTTTYSNEFRSITNYAEPCFKGIEAILTSQTNEDTLSALKDVHEVLNGLIRESKDSFREQCSLVWPFGEVVPNHISKAQWQLDRIIDTQTKIHDFLENLTDVSNMVRILDKKELGSVSFKNIDESGLITKTLIDKSAFKIFMSATIGNPETYANFIGLTNYEYISIDNQFDLKKSPIIYIRGYKLNYSNMEENFPKVVDVADAILKKHENQRGIIHSSSFALAKNIIDKSKNSDRFITYESSLEKNDALSAFMNSTNGVLIGPSLLEGLDFGDDMSRFQVFFKVPFPNISDEFMKKLVELYPKKYMMKTVNNIIQGTGRSIRSKDDWAITYILDECFDQIIKSRLLPTNFSDRLIIRKIS